jgi:hypothetical protein
LVSIQPSAVNHGAGLISGLKARFIKPSPKA